MNPKLSVLCVTFNAGPRMEDTLEGVVFQTYQNWELLVMDGGSKDGTVEMVKEYGRRDPRIKIYSEPDEGPLHACEKGLAIAKGDYLIFICGQDFFTDENWFSEAVDVLERDRNVSLVWALGFGVTEDGKKVATNASYSHFVEGRGWLGALGVFASKALEVVKTVLFGDRERRKFLLRKIFSGTAPFRMRSIIAPGFRRGKLPQKEDWFFYWLKTGLVFPDQAIVVSKNVYLECAPHYEMGSRRLNSYPEFVFNFNVNGYMAYFIPKYVSCGLLHAGSSGQRAARELYIESQKYFDKVFEFGKSLKRSGRPFIFQDRQGNKIGEQKF